MSRRVYVWRNGKVVLKHQRPVRARIHLIRDFQEPVKSLIDGKHYDSRRHYLDHVKDNGCEIVGNDFNDMPMTREVKDDSTIKDDIARTIEELS